MVFMFCVAAVFGQLLRDVEMFFSAVLKSPVDEHSVRLLVYVNEWPLHFGSTREFCFKYKYILSFYCSNQRLK